MKKLICVSLVIVSMLLMSAASGFAWHGGGGGRGWGPGWGPVIGLGLGLGIWELSYPYYPYSYNGYYTPPVIIQQQAPEVYYQPSPQYAPPAPIQEPSYWYYCRDSQGYYPYVKECPKGWMKVVPTPPAPQ